jgi:hypothetical protein
MVPHTAEKDFQWSEQKDLRGRKCVIELCRLDLKTSSPFHTNTRASEINFQQREHKRRDKKLRLFTYISSIPLFGVCFFAPFSLLLKILFINEKPTRHMMTKAVEG